MPKHRLRAAMLIAIGVVVMACEGSICALSATGQDHLGPADLPLLGPHLNDWSKNLRSDACTNF
jgi:hypothetical protein